MKKSKSDGKPAEHKRPPAERAAMRAVTRTVREGTLVHFYLGCGHLLTMHIDDFQGPPSSIECWACKAESHGP